MIFRKNKSYKIQKALNLLLFIYGISNHIACSVLYLLLFTCG